MCPSVFTALYFSYYISPRYVFTTTDIIVLIATAGAVIFAFNFGHVSFLSSPSGSGVVLPYPNVHTNLPLHCNPNNFGEVQKHSEVVAGKILLGLGLRSRCRPSGCAPRGAARLRAGASMAQSAAMAAFAAGSLLVYLHTLSHRLNPRNIRFRRCQIITCLHVQPEPRRGIKYLGEAQGGVGGD